jgi:hypothetical protein
VDGFVAGDGDAGAAGHCAPRVAATLTPSGYRTYDDQRRSAEMKWPECTNEMVARSRTTGQPAGPHSLRLAQLIGEGLDGARVTLTRDEGGDSPESEMLLPDGTSWIARSRWSRVDTVA